MKRMLVVILSLAIALVSIFVVAKRATLPDCYKNTIQSIDEKKAIVMAVTTVAAATSTALAAIPGDATTPIANQIMNISLYLLIVVCALLNDAPFLMYRSTESKFAIWSIILILIDSMSVII